MKTVTKLLCAAAVSVGYAASAHAAVITLDFEGIYPTYPSNFTGQVQEFYNGGTSSEGESGTNYGISFSDNALAICLNTAGISCPGSNTGRGGQGNPNSQKGALFFLSGVEAIMNIAAGFDTGFSFFYSAIGQGGNIGVYDGLNGTGTLLKLITLTTTPSGPCPSGSGGFCPFVPFGVAFDGMAKSVSFAGVANQIVFDDVTFGSVIPDPGPGPTPGEVPLPASLPLLAAGLGGMALLRRKKAA